MRSVTLLLLGLVLVPSQSSAQSRTSSTALFEPASPAEPTSDELVWPDRYTRFRPAQYATNGLLIGANALADVLWVGVDQQVWHGGILFDDAIRRSYKNVPQGPRQTLRDIGDYSLLGLTFFPFVIDSLATALVVRGSPDVAWQTTMISMQSILTSSLLNILAKRYITRNRPGIAKCEKDCQNGSYRSFYSGHTAQTFVGAGIICTHHAFLDLWGGGLADDLVCAGALGLGVVTGISRIVGDAHYTTDVLVGASVGLAAGVLLPAFLHYQTSKPGDEFATMTQIVPNLTAEGGGLTLVGRF